MHDPRFMNVRDVMTQNPATCTPDTSVEQAARLMDAANCGAIPVVGDHQMPIGVVTDRDIAIRVVARGLGVETTVRACMTTPAHTITEDTSLDACMDLMQERQVRRCIVVGSDGRVTGIVAQADIAEHASRREVGELLQQVSKPGNETGARGRV